MRPGFEKRRQRMRLAAGIVLCSAALFRADAKTNYVDCTMLDDIGPGDAVTNAFKTIQAAVNASSSDDTIIVLPGVYDSGGKTDGAYGLCRVYAYNKSNLTIESRDGKEATHIVGNPDPETGGLGPGAARCIFATGDGTRIKGFTIRDGWGGSDSSGNTARGSALMGSGTKDVYLIDCVISNCHGRAALWYGTAIRCLISGNSGGYDSSEVVGYNSKLYQSLVVGNRSPGYYTLWDGHAVNCTFVDNDNDNGIYTASTAGSSHIYNCVISYGDTIKTKNSSSYFSIANTTTNDEYALVAPALGDYRVRAGGPADGTADRQWLDDFNIPEEEKWFDYTGAKIDKTAPMQQGAIQEKATTEGGALVVGSRMSVNGGPVHLRPSYVFAANWPAQFLLRGRPANGDRVQYYSLSAGVPHGVASVERPIRAPQVEDDCYLAMPPSDAAKALGVYAFAASGETYVAQTGSDDTGDGSRQNPYRTIQKAVDEQPGGGVVHVAEGVYGEGEAHYPVDKNGAEVTQYGKAALTVYNKAVRIIADDGPEKTFIVGAADPDYAADPDLPGCGPNAARCVLMWIDGVAILQGFTLTGGATDRTASGVLTGGGGGCFGYNGHPILTDCIVSNNAASFGAATFNTQVQRSLIAGNKGTNGTVMAVGGSYSTIAGSVLSENASDRGDGAIGGPTKAFNCTIVGDAASSVPIGTSSYACLGNCIVSGAKDVYSAASVGGSLFWNAGSLPQNAMCGDPRFVDAASGDYRLLSTSSAVYSEKCGTEPHWAWYQYVSTGYGGKPLVKLPGGRVLAGAVQETVVAGPEIVVAASSGGLAISPGVVGVNSLSDGDTLTVSPCAGSRPCIGFVVNGVTNLFADLPDGSRTFTYAETAAAGGFCVEAVYDDANWHVDANDGNDAWPGCAAYPRRTLEGVMTNAVSGDVVHAAPGDYNEGSMVGMDGQMLKCRVFIPSGVTLVADKGPEKTFITGSDATEDMYETGILKGCGANALRCVHVASNAEIKGFTVRNGRIYYTKSEHSSKDTYDTRAGGIYLDNQTSSIARDCIITNCVGYRGGASYLGTLVNCRMVDCKSNDGVARSARLYGCFIGRTYGTGACRYGRNFYDCTISDEHWNANGTEKVSALGTLSASNPFENCLILGRVSATEKNPAVLTRCVLLTNSIPEAASPYVTCTDCIFTNREALLIDENYRPLPGSFLIDFFATTNSEAIMEGRDVLGGQRVYNGARDFGAFEYDWRAEYAATLGLRSTAVVRADPGVVKHGDLVCIGAGSIEIVEGPGAEQSTKYIFPLQVTGSGTLSAMVNGEVSATFTAAAGETVFKFRNSAASNTIAFEYSPGADETGAAYLGTASVNSYGSLIIMR